LILICFTGEKFTTGQERFALWCSAPQAVRDAPGVEFIPASGGRGRSPTAMKQVNIKDRWYNA